MTSLETFHLIATVLSMVLGLGVTRLLLGVVSVFRAREHSPVDWVPLAWAGWLFLSQLEYWWAINQLPSIRADFTFLDFVFLVILTLALFASAALLLPSRAEDERGGLRAYFEKDGRYGLLALAAFSVLGLLANVAFFNASPISAWGLLDIPMIALPCAAFAMRSRQAQVLIVLLYMPVALIDIWVSLAS